MDMAEAKGLAPGSLQGELRFNEPMRKHTSWRVGGPADRAYVPASLDDLCAFLRATPASEPLLFVGLGSNLLVRDKGVRGTVVLLHGALKELSLQAADATLYAEAGVPSPKVARFAALHGLEGAEFFAGIPGTVGGALAMNAGCYGRETWEIVERVLMVDRRGERHVRTRGEFHISYRTVTPSVPREEVFAAAWMRLPRGDGERSRQRIKELLQRRIASQPLEVPNAGSVFRNPPGDFAARLIESCGLKGAAVGGAVVSAKHANFIVNEGAATALDIETLIVQVQRAVHDKCGIDLEREVRIVGEV